MLHLHLSSLEQYVPTNALLYVTHDAALFLLLHVLTHECYLINLKDRM